MIKILTLYKYIFSTLEKKLKTKLLVLFSTMLIAAIMEVGSIASVVPFLQNILSTERGESVVYFDKFLNNFQLYKNYKFSFITIFFITFILSSLLTRLILLKLMFRFTKELGYFLASKIFNKITHLSYLNYSKENSSKYLSILETKVDRIVDMVHHLLETISSMIILLFIFITLLLINIYLTISVFLFFIICYFFLYSKFKLKMHTVGEEYSKGLTERMKNVQEIFGSFKLLKIDQMKSQSFFKNKFLVVDNKIRSALETINFLGNFPRYLVEGIAILFISLLAFFLINYEIYSKEIIILFLGVIGFAAQRLLPLIQKIYYSISLMNSQKEAAYEGIEFLLNNSLSDQKKQDFTLDKKFKFTDSIYLKNVSFSYSKNNKKNIFSEINLKIKKNSKICILGKTGSGKSTFVDLIVGLIEPESGKILIDDYNLNYVKNFWQEKISYVPQSTYLLDATILDNIAFGVEKNNIDLLKIEKSIYLSGLKKFVSDLPKKIYTTIGERGIQLSGGQIQRLGLARAFYKNFEVLFLDESTNALDSETEKEIYKNINMNFEDKTVIVITHKKEISRYFKEIIEIKDGKIEIIINDQFK